MRRSTRFPSLIAALVAVVAVAAVATPSAEASWARGKSGKSLSIVDRLEKAGSFTVLLAALETAKLKETLETEGPFTLFAPTDDAFGALLAKLGITAEDLLANPDLAKILLYHVAGGDLGAGELLKSSTQATLSDGRPLLVVLEGLRVKVNGINVVRANVKAANGVIHYLDGVLLPPAGPLTISSLVDVLELDGRFTVLLAALDRAGLDDVLATGGPFTLFAPTDDAFTALLAELGVTADQLLDNPALTDILLYHVVEGRRKAFDLLAAREAETLQGDEVKVRMRSEGIFVNASKVRNANVNAPNGIIHTLDAVLLP